MPEGTRVHRCVEKLKGRPGVKSAYAICQASTGQSYAIGKSKRKSDKKPVGSPSESFERKLTEALRSVGGLGSLQEPGGGMMSANEGQQVEILEGPWAGFAGEVEETWPDGRARVFIPEVQRSVQVWLGHLKPRGESRRGSRGSALLGVRSEPVYGGTSRISTGRTA